jgi:ribosome-associated toxin RatA of RatAB toxin-antitoxin module
LRFAIAPELVRATHAFVRCAIPLAILASSLIGAVHRADAAAIAWHVSRVDDGIAIDASALLRADLPGAWRVLTDYDRYPEFIPGLRASRVIARRGRDVVVEQRVDVTLWLFRAPVDVTYEITEHPPLRVVSRSVGGCTCTLDSTYTLSRDGAQIRLAYRGRLVTGSGAVSLLENAAGERTAMKQFRALAHAIEARAQAGAEMAPTWRIAK